MGFGYGYGWKPYVSVPRSAASAPPGRSPS